MADTVRQEDLPRPPGKLIRMRYRASVAEWYALTDQGWFWFDKKWKLVPQGPIDQ